MRRLEHARGARHARLRVWAMLGCALWLSPVLPCGLARADAAIPEDAVLHFGASAAISGAGYAISAPFVKSRPARAAIAFGAGMTAGAAKELYDLAGYGDPSLRDLGFDVLGAATGSLLAWLIDRLVSGGGEHCTNARPFRVAAAP